MRELALRTERRTQLVEITNEVRSALDGVADAAAVLVFVPHTTAAVTVNENVDAALEGDFERALERVIADGWDWRHSDADGPNAPAHVRASLVGPQVLVPLRRGELALGTWQGIFLCEFDGPRERRVYVTPLR